MYSAESIVAALKANKELSFEGIDAIGCPSRHVGCGGVSDKCDICLNQRCKQPVAVFQDLHKMSVLNFRFMVSTRNHGGFIRKDDSTLERLLNHNLIDKTMLRTVV